MKKTREEVAETKTEKLRPLISQKRKSSFQPGKKKGQGQGQGHLFRALKINCPGQNK